MKIAIPVDKTDINSNVSDTFGRAVYFLIYDTETNLHSFVDNNAVKSSGGAGINAAQTVVDQNADTLLTPRCGGNAEEVLKAAEIKIQIISGGTANDQIQAFIKENL